MIAEVLVDVAHHQVDQRFDYTVPKALEDHLEVGMRVEVPFGPRKITGFVMNLKKESDIEKLKPIHALRDIFPYFNSERLELAEHLAFKHVTPRVSYLNAMLPSALSMRYRTLFTVRDKESLHPALKPYFEDKKTVDAKKIAPSHLKHIKQHIESGEVEAKPEIRQKAGMKTVPYVILKSHGEVKGEKQKAVLAYLDSHDGVSEKAALQEAVGASNPTLKRLEEKGIIAIVSRERYRELKSLYGADRKPVTLTAEQENASMNVRESFGSHKVFLLHGVTSSGKTEIYIKLVRDVIETGRTAIVLLPEISLTPKILARFKAVFENRIAVYHSRLSPGEQYDEWRKVIRGEVDIVIGARSAIFTPLENIGIIIIDEEHSDTYTQNDPPEYDAKAVAEWRGSHHDAPVLLGSATPSITSYYRALEKDITLLTLTNRVLKSVMPTIDLIDMKEEFKKGNPSIFSTQLYEAIEKRLDNQEQILLLINRRGHAQFVLCRNCGKRIKCPDCDISLTYHRKDDSLKCHYCGHSEQKPDTCPACGSRHIRFMGLGSERVEAELNRNFPDASVYRMDKDTTTRKDAHENLLYHFEKDGDILVGTQMISKGLDFSNVTLVGVLSADMALFVPDFYAESETFALLTQIAGRSGRREKKGSVLIQAYNADHRVLNDVKEGDYEGFYKREIAFRKTSRVEPFCSLTQILIIHEDYGKAYKKALEILNHFKKNTDFNVLGPTDHPILRQAGMYRVQLIVRHDHEPALYQHLHDVKDRFTEAKTTITITHNPRVL